MTTQPPLRVLLVDAGGEDARRVADALGAAAALVELQHVHSLSIARAALGAGSWDVALVQLDLPEAPGPAGIAAIRAAAPRVPVVALAAASDDALAVAALRAGAEDLLVRDEVPGAVLPRTLYLAVERRRADEALRASQARYREIFERAGDGIFVASADGRLLEVNPAAAALFGYTREEMLALPPGALYRRPADRDALIQAGREQGHIYDEVEFEAVRKDGDVIRIGVISTPLRAADGTVQGYHGSVRDLTARRRAQHALRESEERLRTVLDAAPLAITVLDADGNVEMWNPAAERVFGWTAVEVLGRPFPLVDADGGTAEVRAFMEAGFAGQRLEGREVRRRRRDGTAVTLQAWNALLPAADRNDARLVAIYVDVSLERELEAQLRQAQRMEAVGRLAGGVAHDFNNVLTVIAGHVELLLADDSLPDRIRDDLQEVSAGVGRATDLTQQLLAFSRRQMLQPRALAINDVVTGLEKMLRRLIGADIRLDVRLEPDIAPVYADPGRMEQVIVNLVLNARDAMPDGGEIRIETANQVAGDVETDAPQPPTWTTLRVSDTGSGMSPDVVPHIFEPFFTTKPQGRGTGLGLATVYGIVKQSGGEITVGTEPGEGSTFCVWLPATGGAALRGSYPGGSFSDATGTDSGTAGSGSASGAAVHRSYAAQSAAYPGATILLVEDEDGVRALVQRILGRAGYNIVAAASAEAALEADAGLDSDLHLLFTDIVMPGMNGVQLARAIRHRRPATPVLFMSGYSAEAIDRRGILQDNAHFLEKPFSPERLLHTVQSILGDFDAPA